MVILHQMVRFKVIFVLVLVVAIIAGYILLGPSSAQDRQGVIELTNLPDQYCPLQAEVVAFEVAAKISGEALFDKQVAVDECRYIVLKNLSVQISEPRQFFIKLPNALAFKLEVDSIKGRYQYALSLGDVNNDNVIDSNDESQVIGALFSTDPNVITKNDIDQDKKVGVLDLSLTRVNRRAGVIRPDGKNWSQT